MMGSATLPEDVRTLFPCPDRVHMMPQRSAEWKQIRVGKITGSEASRLFPKRGTWERLIQEKAYESLGIDWHQLVKRRQAADGTDRKTVNRGNVEHVIRGTMLEPEVREHYRRLTDSSDSVFEVGFVQYQRRPGDTRFNGIDSICGCSPDGVNSKDGEMRIIEIKCPSDDNFEKTRAIPENYRYQMAFNCLMCGVPSCDFIVFNRNLGMSIESVEFGQEELETIGNRLAQCAVEVVRATEELLKKIALDKS